MARTSERENKNVYWQARDKMGLTREEASDLLETIPPERVARIEYEQFLPHPDEVLVMAEKYKEPMLCNYYCSQQCPIGQQYVPEIKIKDLSQIVLEIYRFAGKSPNTSKHCLFPGSVQGRRWKSATCSNDCCSYRSGWPLFHPSGYRAKPFNNTARGSTNTEFPDNYYFESKKVTPSRTLAFKQIGNAVPVCLAYHIALSLIDRFAE